MAKYKIYYLCILLISAMATFGQDKKPNIVIIIGDDISYNDFGFMGHKTIRTPNIDSLAKNGLRFNNAYLTASSCSPSRVSIMTGRYPHNTGAAELHTPVPEDQLPFPKILKDNGYYTMQAGKWHLGASADKPEGIFLSAFDRVGGSYIDGGGYSGADKWTEYLQDRPKGKPFFAWFAAHDAHRNWDHQQKPITYTMDDVHVPDYLVDTKATRSDLAAYYEEVSRFDESVGKVVAELKAQGIFDHTLILVMADNGRPFPRNKTRLYDDGIKTPMVLHWPAIIKKKNMMSSSLLSVIDIAPTLLDIAEIKLPSSFQGKSFKRLLSNPEAKFRSFVFAEHNWHSFMAYGRMVRDNEYVYIENGIPDVNHMGATDIMGGAAGKELKQHYLNGKATKLQASILVSPQPRFELYNYKADPDQLNNLSARSDFSKIKEKLAKTLATWKSETGDDQPNDLTPDWSDRWTNKALPIKGTRGTMPGAKSKAPLINRPGPF